MLARLTDATEGRVLLADDGRQIDVAHIRREDMKRRDRARSSWPRRSWWPTSRRRCST
jgi:hypothetical protein